MNLLIHLLSMFLLRDGAALARTAPEPMTAEVGAEHVTAARLAADRHGVDPDLLLSIAAHESRYHVTEVTAEPGGLVSCGVMTPVPMAACVEVDPLMGYDAGARHLRGWLDATHGDLRVALLGYAGGYRMIKACASGRVPSTRGGREVDLCSIPDVFTNRAAWIRRERDKEHHGVRGIRPRS